MPFIQEAASAIKTRFGFQTRDPEPAVVSSPDLLKSVYKENPCSSLVATSTIGEWEEDDDNTSSSAAPQQQSQCFDFSEDPSFWKNHNVQVIIRLRPLSSSEISLQGYNKCVRQESGQSITWTGHPESRFTFDVVADEGVSQEKLFKLAGLPMVENCMGGYNSCMFAYGQTGSGKTHTMLGDIEGGTRRHSVNCGMTPRVFECLFTRIQKEKEARKDEKIKFTCKCSFLEIYNEQILDLLDPSSTNLQIREDVKKGIYVENLKEIEVASAREVIQQLIQGAANRKVAATNMNRASSRSHSVFTCVIESKWESQRVNHHRFARLNLVDLAGSERQKSSGAEGERLKEATNINKSLSTLGLVIMNLVSMSNGKSLHVPYRDSKLTFLLQDSLGGNSKTTIIANISPSICCSLETLSTLKFAQRAKFIKNNAIINEDTSGDVMAMRMQIQQLKKEVARLRGLANGGAENQDNDTSTVGFLGSPGFHKWEGLHGSVSPLLSDKRMSQKKDYEVALVGAFKREKDKDIALKALTAESQAAMQLAKQREDEIQGLKMRLRFREAGIKRLEAVASGKISAETHLLKEKEEHLKEIEVLRTQVDRNQEVTRFAMENLRLKEEIRRLKSFYEEGEREMMNEQIVVLQNKLLEALDWKLMNESDSVKRKIDVETEVGGDSLISVQEPAWQSSIKEENEFLRMQAIHNQAEIDALHKQLDYCLVEKAKLETDVNDLLEKLEEERSSRATNEGPPQQCNLPHFTTDASVSNVDDQMEIKAMVDAIAAASNREAEAHEKSIILSKENTELQLKLEKLVVLNNELESKIKGLIEEKNSLIEMYERAASESNNNNLHIVENAEHIGNEVKDKAVEAADVEMKPSVEELEHQLLEMHEENEKLMVLYEKAMLERDEFKRMLSCIEQNQVNSREVCPEKLVEVDTGECTESSMPPLCSNKEYLLEENNVPELTMEDREFTTPKKVCTGDQFQQHIALSEAEIMKDPPVNAIAISFESSDPTEANTSLQIPEASAFDNNTEVSSDIVFSSVFKDSNLIWLKLATAQEKLSNSSKVLTVLGLLEKAFVEFDHLSQEITATERRHQAKQEDFRSLEKLSSESQERKRLTDRKLSAVRHSLSGFTASVASYEQQEARARARVNTSSSYLENKKEELTRVQVCKCELEAALRRTRETEAELRNKLGSLKCKLEEENQKQENEKVLFSIENMDREDGAQQKFVNLGKATELLKSEEEKTKIKAEITLSREKLSLIRKESEDLSKKYRKIETDLETVQSEVDKAMKSVEEMEVALEGVHEEKETLLDMKEKVESEIQRTIVEYLQNVFESDLKEAEKKIVEDELQPELQKIEELRTVRTEVSEKMRRMLEETSSSSCLLSDQMEEELRSVKVSIAEAKALLEEAS